MNRWNATLAAWLLVAIAGPAAAQDKAPAKPAPKAAGKAEKVVGRDWTKIDTNNDGYISPDEMDVWLKANPGPQK